MYGGYFTLSRMKALARVTQQKPPHLKPKKLLNAETCLTNDCPHRPFGEITRMVWNSHASTCPRIPPDLVAPFGVTVKLETRLAQLGNNIKIAEPTEAPH